MPSKETNKQAKESKSGQSQAVPPPVNVHHVHPQPVVQQVLVHEPPTYFGPDPCVAFCRNCQANVVTRVRPINGLITYLCCYVCLPFLCCCLPFCMDCSRDVEHSCPQCNAPISVHKRMGC